VEEIFQAAQPKAPAGRRSAAAKQLAVLELKRATAIGIRMSRLGCSHLYNRRAFIPSCHKCNALAQRPACCTSQ
jgi:hypothetical protein